MDTRTCHGCGTENPESARFCMSCGTALARACAACGTEAPGDARFCMSCGAPLEAGAEPASTPTPAPRVPMVAGEPAVLPEERRRVTILFADLSGYTAVAERMDPEALKGLIDRSLRRLVEEVEKYGGTVDKLIGDNVMALFGAPVAHEDDPERAVRAALGMQHAMTEINEDLGTAHGISFALRVGINTGEVVAGAMGDGYTVIGDTVNVASRLQSAGRPGSVTVGEQTFRATSDAIEYRELAALELKGKAEPVPAWEAAGVAASEPERRASGFGQARLVGREEELRLVETLFEKTARESRPHLVTLIGQAGVGKTRLLREIEQRLGSRATFREGRCLPYGSSIVYWALGEVIRAECGIIDGDSSDVARDKLNAYVEGLLGATGENGQGQTRERMNALIARLLGIESGTEVPAETEDPQRVRESFFSAVRAGLEARARQGPLVLAFEDVHWADNGMLDLIEHLAQWVRGPLFVICLAREELLERRPGWGAGRRQATSLFLDPLTDDEIRELVAGLLPESVGTGEAIPLIAERAGGNPLFAEEMVRHVAEEGFDTASELPDTVQAVLAARLDSLEPFERRLVQQAAVVGRTFWAGSLVSVATEGGRDLGEALMRLQEKEIFEPSASIELAGEQEYAFKHVLIRDVAYGRLPKAVRAQKHFEVGRFIEERSGDRIDEVVALLAEHYGRGAALGRETGLAGEELERLQIKALHFLEAAGDAAASLYSNREAFRHYRQARDLDVARDPSTLARLGEKQGDVAVRLGHVDNAIALWTECLDYHRGQESLNRVGDLHRKVGAGLWHKGETKEAIGHYQRGINLLKDGPPSLELVHLYEEAASLYMHTGDNMLAIYASEKALRLAERLSETRAASRAHGIFGRVFGRIGDGAKARENLERSVELARGSDQLETIRALLTLGYHREVSEADYAGSEEAYAEALELAEQVGDLPAQVELQSALALLAAYRADWDRAAEFTEASAELAEREGLVGKLSYPYGLRGLLRWREGDWDGAESAQRRAHELACQVGWSEVEFASLFGLAMTLRDRGDTAGATTALDQALDVCERAGLVAQSIQVIAARAVILSLAGRMEQARESAQESADLADRLHYPLGQAAALEARGATAEDALEGAELLAEARAAWSRIGRPMEAARCRLLAGKRLLDADPARSEEELRAAGDEYAELGVAHLSETARRLLPA